MSKQTILVADDEYGFRFPYLIYLRQRDFEVMEASTETEVFAQLSDANLLMMDVIFPDDREGIEIVKKIRKLENEKIRSIPVIFYSILPESMCVGESLEYAEPYTWLQKPFEFEHLLNKINKLIL